MSERERRVRRHEYEQAMRQIEKDRSVIELPGLGKSIAEDPTEPKAVNGLDSVELNTALLEFVQPAVSNASEYKRPDGTKMEDMAPISRENFLAEMAVLKAHHNQPDFDKIFEMTQRTITHVGDFILDGDINEFINCQQESEAVSEFIRDHPEQHEDVVRRSRQQYALEHVLASIQSDDNVDLNTICQEYGITLWPDLKLYSNEYGGVVHSLKPHQVASNITMDDRLYQLAQFRLEFCC